LLKHVKGLGAIWGEGEGAHSEVLNCLRVQF
jgi:hypothetical protein